MRTFGLIALLVILLITGWLSTRQVAMVPAGTASAPTAAAGNVREQAQQIQQQFKQQLEGALQAPRALPDDAR